VAQRIKAYCEELGAKVEIDDAGEKVGGNTGNVIARFPGTIPGTASIMMSAHMDTVVPAKGLSPLSKATLFAPTKPPCSAVMTKWLRRNHRNHSLPAGTEHSAYADRSNFSICEEVGLLGAKNVDVSKLKSKYGIVFDSDDPGFLFTKGPSSNHMEFRIHGLESHAGVAPEDGISAIRIAAEGVAAMTLGRIDEETTANIGEIHGGMPRTLFLIWWC